MRRLYAFCIAVPVSLVAYGQQAGDAQPATPSITAVSQFEEQGTDQSGKSDQSSKYIVQITGANLPADSPTVILFPSISASPIVLSNSSTGVTASFSAGQGYSIQQLALSYKTGAISTQTVPALSCQWDSDVTSSFQFIDSDAAKTSYGAGVSKNFRVIQLSVLNRCPLPITIPLASIDIVATKKCTHDVSRAAIVSTSKISPAALDYITAFYNEDKGVTGRRAALFNTIAAASNLGSAIQPYFGKGFAQGVAILGGGFTTAAQTIYKDMSAQQLQALTSQSFGNAEQLSARTGSLRKYLFVPLKIEDPQLSCALDEGNVNIQFIAIPTITSGTAVASPAP